MNQINFDILDLNQLQEEAARYRYLRDQAIENGMVIVDTNTDTVLVGEALDSEIDEAMEAEVSEEIEVSELIDWCQEKASELVTFSNNYPGGEAGLADEILEHAGMYLTTANALTHLSGMADQVVELEKALAFLIDTGASIQQLCQGGWAVIVDEEVLGEDPDCPMRAIHQAIYNAGFVEI